MLTHRARCIEASDKYPTLGENRWGLAPCSFRDEYFVHEVRPNVDDKDIWCDGVLPPYAAARRSCSRPKKASPRSGSIARYAARTANRSLGADPANGGYGFVDSFRLDPPFGQDDNLGIDQGPMLLAIENARTGLVWRLFMQHPAAQQAVERLQLERR